MALWEMRPIHKAGYLLLVIWLMFIENRAIDKDRADFARDEACRRQEERQQFSDIGTAITTNIQKVIDDSDLKFKDNLASASAQFSATMGKTQEGVDDVTGGKSYPVVTMLPAPLEGTVNTFRLTFNVFGKNPLYDVDVDIRELPFIPPNIRSFATTGTLPGVSKLLNTPSVSPGVILPILTYSVTPALNKVSDYQIVTHARNGKFVEILHIRKAFELLPNPHALPSWEQSWEITRNDKILKRTDWYTTK